MYDEMVQANLAGNNNNQNLLIKDAVNVKRSKTAIPNSSYKISGIQKASKMSMLGKSF